MLKRPGLSAKGPGCVKTRTTGRQSINFTRFSAPFRHYRLGAAKKFPLDAPFSDNFRVFIQSGTVLVSGGGRMRRRELLITLGGVALARAAPLQAQRNAGF